MKLKEWAFLLGIMAIGIITTNLIGFNTPISDSLMGVLILCSIAFIAVCVSKIIPLKLPFIIYCSVLGMLLALPISPIGDFVSEAAGNIEFRAPITMVGALAGIAIGASVREFTKLNWRIIVVALVVMSSTFIASVIIAQVVMNITN
ncbi:hypothetical protein [Natribacillus halophilus]|uniref:DUF340 domain-containing protein n=1 Tax=Natribacillus halophilus TaxID=549003 RepID=A0A1G8N1F7_9BACI|nr:hypothetical protein [Natribacillus halophilus]SDI73440.1 hypothetical protein SAMN04488123_105125 [Natribacillus halophilus]